MLYQVFESPPEDFKAQVEVVALYLNANGEILLLQSGVHKDEAGKWGLPGGKLEKGESLEEGARRELFEETGIALPHAKLRPLPSLYIRKKSAEYTFHAFEILLDKKPAVALSDEHTAYIWIDPGKPSPVPLMTAGDEAIAQYVKLSLSPDRSPPLAISLDKPFFF